MGVSCYTSKDNNIDVLCQRLFREIVLLQKQIGDIEPVGGRLGEGTRESRTIPDLS